MKPIPMRILEMMREAVSAVPPSKAYKATSVINADEIHTIMCVRNPATLCAFSRSYPIIAPSTSANKIRFKTMTSIMSSVYQSSAEAEADLSTAIYVDNFRVSFGYTIYMLTKRQKQILDYVNKRLEQRGIAPSLEEIARHFHLSSVATIHEHLQALEKKGVLRRVRGQARALETRKPKNTLVSIPIVGTITAGQPIEAIEVPSGAITISRDEIDNLEKHYALRVEGNSMIDEGIFDGDTVVIRKQESAENGQTVVAIIDDNQATLKKLYREHGRFRLQPANPTLFPMYRDEVEVRGVVVRIIRNLESQLDQVESKNEKYVRKIDYSWDYRGEKTKSHTRHTYLSGDVYSASRAKIAGNI